MNRLVSTAVAAALVLSAGAAHAGNVYLTGHDPDFHAQGQLSGQNQLNVALNYVTGGTYNDVAPAQGFLWVESRDPVLGGHMRGYDGLGWLAGPVTANATWVDASQLAAVNFNNYSAIVVASSFGGMLTSAEINALIARSADIATFVNGGGGLAAFAECTPTSLTCDASTITPGTNLFGFLPITVTSVNTVAPYNVTAFGASLGLLESDVDDCCTHNSFGLIGGLQVVDFDQAGVATTLAGNVRINDTGLSGTPEPGTWALMLLGFGGVGALLRRRQRLAFS